MARTRGSIGVQLVGLLIVSLLAAQLISFATIVLTPPPRPQIYRVAEIAEALKGGSLTIAGARPLVRSTAARPPEEPERWGRTHPAERALAEALGLPLDSIRLVRSRPGPGRLLSSMTMRGWRMDRRPPFPEGPPAPPQGPLRPGSDLNAEARQAGPPFPWNEPVFEGFTAAAQLQPGVWTIVRTSPEGFPSQWQRRILMWLLAGFVVVAPAGLLFARRITAPLKRFSAAAEQLGRNPQGPTMLLSGPAEIGAAAEAFNRMQRRLKRFVEDRTAMVGAVSHDLRTPLARIRFKMERADPALKASVLGDVAQMEQMLAGVLAFIRNEGEASPRERLDLLSLVECVVDNAAMVGGDVQIVEGVPVTVEGDLVALQRLFANLVDNAIKYGRRARIEVRAVGGHAQVLIADDGPGIPEAEMEDVFRPFYRVDPARNMDAGGIGLGLAIARTAARAHGGDITLANGSIGLKVVVTLPLTGD